MKPQPREPKRYDPPLLRLLVYIFSVNLNFAVFLDFVLTLYSYDFEASSAAQSAEIVAALKKQIDMYKLDHGTVGV